MARIFVFDTTLRDGEQSPGASMTRSEKLRLAHQIDALGADVIEAGFPASSPEDFRAVRDIAFEVRRPTIAALARATAADIDRAAEALSPAAAPRIHTFIATSDVHLRNKLRIDQEECIDRIAAAVERARQHVDDVEFSAEDATRTDFDFLCRAVTVAIQAGAGVINIPDTVGYTYPAEYQSIFEALRSRVANIDDVTLSAHCHDDLGLAVANTLAAVQAGVRQVECTVNGIGERAGNAALEEVIMALAVRHDILGHSTSVDATELYRTSHLLSSLTGIWPQPNKAIVGKNAFAHEAGIHQDGMIKDRSTYEIITPRSVGAPQSQLVLGKHSGRSALVHRYRVLGYELEPAELERAYQLFLRLADRKKTVLDEDLISILHYRAFDDTPAEYQLEFVKVTCGGAESEACVGLAAGGRPARSGTGAGDGPIAAVFAAIDTLTGTNIELVDLTIRAATPGRDAAGEVTIQGRIAGRSFTGRGVSTDIVRAAAESYVHVLNKSAQATAFEAAELAKAGDTWGV